MEKRFQPGDIVATPAVDGGVDLVKVLRVDEQMDDRVFHVMIFDKLDAIPGPEQVQGLGITCMHAPLASLGDGIIVASTPVERHELDGFHAYLRETDFPRYVRETGGDVNAIVAEAKAAYTKGNELADEGRFHEALEAFIRAERVFPLFWEAVDNQGFTHMDLGDWDAAIDDFSRSLQVNPVGYAATFSTGECLFKLGHHARATRWFERAVQLDQARAIGHEWLARARERAGTGDAPTN